MVKKKVGHDEVSDRYLRHLSLSFFSSTKESEAAWQYFMIIIVIRCNYLLKIIHFQVIQNMYSSYVK